MQSATASQAAAADISSLVRAAQAGDQEAFEQLYRLHVGRINAICRRMLGDPRWAEDVVQDAFVRAWLMLAGFRHESCFGSWLYRLTVNAVLLELRSTKRRRARVMPCEDITELDHRQESPAPDQALDLETAIAGLPEKARLVFVLHEVEGYQHDEIAEMLGTAVGTCKAQLHRARHLLRERLQR
ncbi:MAG: sigma-70 family RNA polymerase sigma factor [Acidobacteria bacterium]|nr:MAG: sigma-70 family RNA polymerase sigma factor [Acidobacteriota bacterium]